VVYEFAKVTQVAPVYEFGGLFSFSHIIKKKVLEKRNVIKL
jgi:hypothetical protein